MNDFTAAEESFKRNCILQGKLASHLCSAYLTRLTGHDRVIICRLRALKGCFEFSGSFLYGTLGLAQRLGRFV